jgi:hypothetical protein
MMLFACFNLSPSIASCDSASATSVLIRVCSRLSVATSMASA